MLFVNELPLRVLFKFLRVLYHLIKNFWQKKSIIQKSALSLQLEWEYHVFVLNSGRWGTIKSFDGLMKARGVEPVLPGYTEYDGFKWCIDSIQQCLPAAEQNGVLLAL
jgi:hypothetical protein